MRFRRKAHWSHAEATDAAPAQIAAHSVSEDNKTTTHSASLVSATATSQPEPAACGGPCGSDSSADCTGCSKHLRTTSPSIERKTGIASWWLVTDWEKRYDHQTSATLTMASQSAVYGTSK